MKNLKNNNYNKILVIRLSSMGDIILTSHLVRNLKEHFPDTHIDTIVFSQYSEIFDNNPYITKVIKYDKTKNNFEQKLQKKEIFGQDISNPYGLIIDLQKSRRSKKIYSGVGTECLKIDKNRLFKLALVYLKKKIPNRQKHITQIYSESVAPLEIGDDGRGLELWLPEDKLAGFYIPYSTTRQSIASRSRIGIAPGAFHQTKKWPPEKFIGLANALHNRYGSEIVLLGGGNDTDVCRQIAENAKCKITDLSGSQSIYDTVRIIDTCRLVVSNDTGIMHMSAARHVPVAAIFGSTVPEFGFTPYRVEHAIIEKIIPCRPCTHYGRAACPKGHFDCMNLIEINDVLKSAENLLK